MRTRLGAYRDRLDWEENQRPSTVAGRIALTVALAVLVLAMLLASARGAEPIPKSAIKWMVYKPAGAVDGQGILRDVTSRCTPQQRQTAYEPDKVTYAHEALHQLHSRIRNSFPEKVSAVYVGGGQCFVLKEPRVRLSTVAGFVPQQHRNHLYSLYLVQQGRDWDDTPLYVLDEAAAYMVGTQAAIELGVDPHGSDQFMMHFNHFIDALLAAVAKHDPGYKQREALTAYAVWHKQRTEEIYRKLHKQ